MQDSDVKYFRAAERSDATTNGGRMSATEIVSSVSSNLWDVIRSAERIAQTIEWEKVFCANHNSSNEVGYSPKVFLDCDAISGDDWLYFIAATQRNTQNDITGSEQAYTAGTLKTSILSTAQTLVVTCKTATQAAAWVNGGKVRIVSARYDNTPTYVDFTVSAAPSVSGLDVTLQSATAFGTAFSAGAYVLMVYEPTDDVEPSLDNTSYTGGADVDDTEITLDNQGTIEQTWTMTILAGATTYSMVGDEVGNVGTGDISTLFEPDNSDYSLPYMSIAAAAFTGLTLAEGDTFIFQTHPAAVPIFWRKENPTSATLANSNSSGLVMEIEG